jgi:protein-disulfide isomerase
MKSYIWLGGLIIVLVAFLFLSVKSESGVDTPNNIGVISVADNAKGNINSPLVVTEYSDFQCSACRVYYFVMRELAVEFGDRVAFVYRHFPLNQHKNAELAARASQAAGKQGKFWEMHDLLFEKQNEWAEVKDVDVIFDSYANLIGLSLEQFKSDFNSKEIKNMVNDQKNGAIKLHLQGTPLFFVGDKLIQNPNSTEAFKTIIREALKNN